MVSCETDKKEKRVEVKRSYFKVAAINLLTASDKFVSKFTITSLGSEYDNLIGRKERKDYILLKSPSMYTE